MLGVSYLEGKAGSYFDKSCLGNLFKSENSVSAVINEETGVFFIARPAPLWTGWYPTPVEIKMRRWNEE
jgi:hypothetical protein